MIHTFQLSQIYPEPLPDTEVTSSDILRQFLASLLRVIETTAGNRAFWLSYLDEDF
jgi:hypothetical protein